MDEKVKTKHFIFNVFVSLHKVECGSKGEIIPCWDHGKNPKKPILYAYIQGLACSNDS